MDELIGKTVALTTYSNAKRETVFEKITGIYSGVGGSRKNFYTVDLMDGTKKVFHPSQILSVRPQGTLTVSKTLTAHTTNKKTLEKKCFPIL